MTNKELLEKIAEAINDSTESITVTVPANNYYWDENNDRYTEDTVEIINPSLLARKLQQLSDSL